VPLLSDVFAPASVPYPFLNVPLVGRLVIYAAATGFAFFTFRFFNALHPTTIEAGIQDGAASEQQGQDENRNIVEVDSFVWFHKVKV
jgi:hypothetical protein